MVKEWDPMKDNININNFFRMKQQNHTSELTTTTSTTTTVALMEVLETYFTMEIPSILLSIMTIILNTFVINCYRKIKLSLVPLLYTLIASMDIITAVAVIHQFAVFSLANKMAISDKARDVNAVVFYTLFQISYRLSVFLNLILAVTRTIRILRPFQDIKTHFVKLACIFYALPWIVMSVMNVYAEFSIFDGQFMEAVYTSYFSFGLFESLKKYDIFNDASDSAYFAHMAPDLLAFSLPAVIIIITCVIQVVSLRLSGQFIPSVKQRHVTTTVILMSSLFVICNSASCGYHLSYLICYIKSGEDNPLLSQSLKTHYMHLAVYETVLPILNAALNPVIIICRSSTLQKKFVVVIQSLMEVARSLMEVTQSLMEVTRSFVEETWSWNTVKEETHQMEEEQAVNNCNITGISAENELSESWITRELQSAVRICVLIISPLQQENSLPLPAEFSHTRLSL
jgi:hypothetical protein